MLEKYSMDQMTFHAQNYSTRRKTTQNLPKTSQNLC